MAAKQPTVGIDHVTVVPTNAARDDDSSTADSDADDADGDGVAAADDDHDRAGDDA
ncbi:hypothetical protein [Halobaculum magnesiiphilum]|uniref:Uncharacterized protein n=1 Tax=Halobaculum magnesiiphilum TaxID=1017351 RepID=A0A8T8WA58_9EURY|nr:hypothetical protein [Halobaculum magnesiiphilum]QZP36742.1 hypothetical protein K6T50_10540 [Halobaculum magnesiiphilum]